MTGREFAPLGSLRAILWIARIVSALIVVFLVLMIVAYIVNPQGNGSGPKVTEGFGLAFFPIGLCVGYVIGWRWQLLGGAISLICLAAFLLLMRERDMTPVISIVGIPAVLYVVYGVYRRRMASGGTVVQGSQRRPMS